MKGKDLIKKPDEIKFQNEIARWQRKKKNFEGAIEQNTDLLKQADKRLKELLNMTVEKFKKK